MDILLGIRTQNEVLLVTSKALARGISVLKQNDNKVICPNTHTAMAFSGEPGDGVNFAEFIQANVQLYGLRHGIPMTPRAVASFSRNELAKSLRTRKPYQVNILLGGYDERESKPLLNWIDYLGANVELPYAAHGYASYYVLATLDRYWKEDLTQEEGLELAAKCVAELEGRMPIDFKGCEVHLVGKDGVKLADLPKVAPAPGPIAPTEAQIQGTSAPAATPATETTVGSA